MTQFLTLPVDGGEGSYHFNHYRIGFYPKPGRSKTDLAGDFVTNFPSYFNSNYANVVVDTEHNFPDAALPDRPPKCTRAFVIVSLSTQEEGLAAATFAVCPTPPLSGSSRAITAAGIFGCRRQLSRSECG